MFEAAELGHVLGKRGYDELEPKLRLELLGLQQKLRAAGFPVIVVFAGVDGAGKSETVNLLNSWLDPRWTHTHAYAAPSDEERERPGFWRYWRDMPPKGKIGFFLSSWYSKPLTEHVYGEISEAELEQRLLRIRTFERILTEDGALILKFWMHLDKKGQKQRLESLQRDPLKSWRVTERDWKHFRMYGRFIATAERVIMRTSTGEAPWHIVEGRDARYREVTVATMLRDAITKHIEQQEALARLKAEQAAAEAAERTSASRRRTKPPEELVEVEDLDVDEGEDLAKEVDEGTIVELMPTTILQSLDMTQALGKKDYNRALGQQQGRAAELFREARGRGLSAILVFEGWDAAGKGGSIRRLTSALDARDYSVIPIAAPTDEERAQHYLWRFWRHLSRAGRVTIFDRSWYGRVLVERIEGFASEREWMRAYGEINHFEERLLEHGIVLCKFWLHITKEEQLARFKAREETPFKRWKLTEEDWRNREKWDDYEVAVNEMIARCSTRIAPWTLVEANDKRFARVKVVTTFADALERALSGGQTGTAIPAAPAEAGDEPETHTKHKVKQRGKTKGKRRSSKS